MTTTYIENPKDAVCQQELEHIAHCDLDWSAFSHKTVLVTGATVSSAPTPSAPWPPPTASTAAA